MIAEDDDTYGYVAKPDFIDAGRLPTFEPPPKPKDHLLVCGWGENLRGLLRILNIVFEVKYLS